MSRRHTVHLFAAAAALMLSGCQSKPLEQMSYSETRALAGEILKRCIAQGAGPGTPDYQPCIQQEITREQATRAANGRKRRALGAALAQASGNMQANAAAQRPITCTSTPTGTLVGKPTSVQTTCY